MLLIKWLITLLAIEAGSTNQLFSTDQSDVKASTPMEPEFQYKELNRNSLVLFTLAHLSPQLAQTIKKLKQSTLVPNRLCQ